MGINGWAKRIMAGICTPALAVQLGMAAPDRVAAEIVGESEIVLNTPSGSVIPSGTAQYYRVSDSFIYDTNGGLDPKAYVEITYKDVTSGSSSFQLQYDAQSGDSKATAVVVKNNSGLIKTKLYVLDDIKFANRTGSTYDFRIWASSGDLTLYKIVVSKTPNTGRVILKGTNANKKVQQVVTSDASSDAYTTVETKNGIEARKISGNGKYFYFQVDDTFIAQENEAVWLKVTYYNAGTDKIKIQYNSATSNYTSVVFGKTDENQNTWKTELVKLNDVKFSNAQVHAADFRIGNNDDGSAEYLSVVEVLTQYTYFDPITGYEVRVLTNRGGDSRKIYFTDESFLPDNEHIVYLQRTAKKGIARLNTRTGAFKLLAPDTEYNAFTFGTDRINNRGYLLDSTGTKVYEIDLLATGTLTPRLVTTFAATKVATAEFSVSIPKKYARYIVNTFQRSDASGYEMIKIDVATGAQEVLYQTGTSFEMDHPIVNPADDTLILFADQRSADVAQRMNVFDLSTRQAVAFVPEGPNDIITHESWDPTGTYATFLNMFGSTQSILLTTKNGIAPVTVVDNRTAFLHAMMGPTTDWIAADSISSKDVWLVNRHTGQATRLLTGQDPIIGNNHAHPSFNRTGDVLITSLPGNGPGHEVCQVGLVDLRQVSGFVASESTSFADNLNTMEYISASFGSLGLDTSQASTYFDGDGSRLKRNAFPPAGQYAHVVYTTSEAMVYFKVSTFFRPPDPQDDFRFYTSTDGTNYAAFTPVRTDRGGDWKRIDYESIALPANTKHLKIEFRTTSGNVWTPQIGNVATASFRDTKKGL